MKYFFLLIWLYPFLAFSKPIYYDTDIQPAFERFSDALSNDPSKTKELDGYGKVMKIYLHHGAVFSTKHKEDTNLFYLTHSVATLACEIYAIEHYKLREEYLSFLKSPELDKAIGSITKDISNHYESIEDMLEFIQKAFSEAMKDKFPKLAKIYTSSIFMESRLRMLSNSGDKNKSKDSKTDPKEAVKDLVLMKELLNKRLQEALDGFAPDDFPKTLHQVAIDLRAYYRLSNCPDDFAYVFVDYLSALDDLDMWAMNTPKEVKPEEAFATVFIWTLAGGNPLESALINERKNAEWQTKGIELQKKLADAENKLSKIVIKYGLRL